MTLTFTSEMQLSWFKKAVWWSSKGTVKGVGVKFGPDSGNIFGRSDFKTCWQMGILAFSNSWEVKVWKHAIVTYPYTARALIKSGARSAFFHT